MCGIPVYPGDGAADLIGEHHETATDVLHPGEVGNDIMRPGGEEHLGRNREILRAAAAPGAAMDEDEDRRRGASRSVDVQPLNLGRPVSDALGLADAEAYHFAVADAALDQLLAVRCIGGLVISCVESRLVVVEEYRRGLFQASNPRYLC
jgi:hypothetical protein